jgi:hypothetical protein
MLAGIAGGLRAACIIELSDGALASRQGTPLVAIYRREARGRSRSGIAQRRGKQVPACGARADDVDLRFGDPARELEAFRIGIPAGDCPRQSFDLVRPGRIVTGGQAQAVATRVLRRARLACAGPRSRAGARIAPVGIAPAGAGHAATSRAGAVRGMCRVTPAYFKSQLFHSNHRSCQSVPA